MSTKDQDWCKPPSWWLCPNHASHFCPEKYHVSACGMPKAKIMSLNLASVTCKRCMRTKAWRTYMGKDKG